MIDIFSIFCVIKIDHFPCVLVKKNISGDYFDILLVHILLKPPYILEYHLYTLKDLRLNVHGS